MKKKLYQSPKMEQMNVEMENQFLTGSDFKLNNTVSGSAQLGNSESDYNVWGD